MYELQPRRPAKSNGCFKWAAITLFASALLFFIAVAAFQVSAHITRTSSSIALAPSPTVVATPTPEPLPTDTPTATATPPPTQEPTPLPTSTSAPVSLAIAQPTSTAISDEKAAAIYVLSVQAITGRMSRSLDVIIECFTELSAEPTTILLYDWKQRMFGALADIEVNNEAIRHLNPSSQFVDMHQDLLASAEHLDNVAVLYKEGIENLDADKMAAAGIELDFALTYLNLFLEKRNALPDV